MGAEQWREWCKTKQVCTYIIRCRNAVKIGSSTDPINRVKQLQTAHSEPLRLEAVLPGGADLEKYLHEKFKDDRLSGEWFHCGPVLRWLFDGIELWQAWKTHEWKRDEDYEDTGVEQ